VAAAGSAGYGPATGDASISLVGAVPTAGGTFYYQSWYRDTAGLCAPSSFNVTNALSISWAP
jgi:hypothetical protein